MPARRGVWEYLLTLDAFTVSGNGAIYIVEQSALLQGARTGSRLHRAMLAAAIWHEMAHLDGATEAAARKAESDLWALLVRDGVTDSLTGLRYLEALRQRPDDERLAMSNAPLREVRPQALARGEAGVSGHRRH